MNKEVSKKRNNKKVRITSEQQCELRKKAKEKLLYIDAIYKNEEQIKKIDTFKSKFYCCESIYKVILEDYYITRDGESKNRLMIDMKEGKAIFKYAGYDIDKDFLSKIFGCEKKVGMRSAKKIRDGLTHNINSNLLKEFNDRYEDLSGYMDLFLNIIRTES